MLESALKAVNSGVGARGREKCLSQALEAVSSA